MLVLVLALGLVVGSFLNALVWRIHKRIPIGGKERSQCTSCHHQLAWYDLIPVFSWILLKGKCRYCHNNISIQYPLIELANAALWGLSFYIIKPDSLMTLGLTVLWLGIVSTMLALAVYDIRWMELPDRLVMVFAVLSVCVALISALGIDKPSIFDILNSLLGVLFIAGLFYFLYQISDGRWIGGGDVKFAVGMGLLLGLQGSILGLFIASVLGSIFGLVSMAIFKKDKKSLIPFGPFLIAATYIVFHFGATIITWYTTNLL